MSVQSLYRRYRPQKFAEVIGQDHIVAALKNAVANERVGHAYLFSGPRGTGKTSTARILAKALNCENPVDGEPCSECGTCQDIGSGRSFDLIELDAASNNGVDAIRDLISMVATAPIRNYKVYVIDEVHMLSAGAENALLKTLEEPPEHVIFVMATTEPHKVVNTVRSRAQHLEFKLIGLDELKEHLQWVAKDAKLDITDADLEYVLKAGGGSVRDSLSEMDQVAAAGMAPERPEKAEQLVEGIANKNTTLCLEAVRDCVSAGGDLRVFVSQAVEIFRNAFLIASKVTPENLTDDELTLATSVSEQIKLPILVNSLEALGEAMATMRSSPNPRIDLEVTLIRLTRTKRDDIKKDIVELIEMVGKLENDLDKLEAAPEKAPKPKQAQKVEPKPPQESVEEKTPTKKAPDKEEKEEKKDKEEESQAKDKKPSGKKEEESQDKGKKSSTKKAGTKKPSTKKDKEDKEEESQDKDKTPSTKKAGTKNPPTKKDKEDKEEESQDKDKKSSTEKETNEKEEPAVQKADSRMKKPTLARTRREQGEGAKNTETKNTKDKIKDNTKDKKDKDKKDADIKDDAAEVEEVDIEEVSEAETISPEEDTQSLDL